MTWTRARVPAHHECAGDLAAARARRRPYEPTPVGPLWVGPTLYRLAPSTGFVLLPAQGTGYYHFGGTDQLDEDAWAEPVCIACIEAVGSEWTRRWPQRPRIGVGDISLRGGGRFHPHREHRLGLDIDIRPVSVGGEHRVSVGAEQFDQQATSDLIALFTELCHVEHVYFNDVELRRGMEIVEHARGHGNHLHVGLAPETAQPAMIRDAAMELMGWVEVVSDEELSASR